MKKTLQFIAMLAAVVLCVTSCNSNAPKLTKYIPKDALGVAGVNAKSLAEKLAKGGRSLDTLASLLSGGDDSTDVKTKWDEIKNSGIDLTAEMYVFAKQTNSIMDGTSSTMGFIASIKDPAAFEQYIKKKKPGGEIKTAGDYSYIALGDDYVAGWKSDVAILANVHGGKTATGTYNTGEGTASQLLLTKLFAQSASESIESVDIFKTAEKEQGDLFYFLNAGASQGALSALSLTKASELIADSYSTGTINFEDGKVTATLTGYTGKALGDILKKYPSNAIDVSEISNYPAPVGGFMSLSFNPQIIVELIKFSGADGMVSQTLGQNFNLTMDDVVKAFKGNITAVMSVDNDAAAPQPGSMPTKLPVTFLVNTAIGDKAAYNKVMAALNAKGVQVPQGGTINVPNIGALSISVTDKNFIVASDATILQQYLAGMGSKTNLPNDVKDMIQGKAFAMYVDAERLRKIKSQIAYNGTADMEVKDTAAPVVKDFIATADKINGSVTKGNAELRLFDEKQNSLVLLIKRAVADEKAGKHFSFPGSPGRQYNDTDSTTKVQ